VRHFSGSICYVSKIIVLIWLFLRPDAHVHIRQINFLQHPLPFHPTMVSFGSENAASFGFESHYPNGDHAFGGNDFCKRCHVAGVDVKMLDCGCYYHSVRFSIFHVEILLRTYSGGRGDERTELRSNLNSGPLIHHASFIMLFAHTHALLLSPHFVLAHSRDVAL
jgi:hypothetical protein